MDKEELEVSESPKKAEKDIKFSYFEPVAGIIFAIVATIIFLGFPQIIAVVFVSGPLIPTFDAEVIRSLWIPIILWMIFRIFVEVFYLIERRYTKRLAIVTMIGNSLAFICSLIIFLPDKIVNVEYISWINTNFANIAVWFGNILANPHVVIIVIMLIGLVLDSITVVRKGFKKKEKTDEEDEFNSEAVTLDIEPEEAEIKADEAVTEVNEAGVEGD